MVTKSTTNKPPTTNKPTAPNKSATNQPPATNKPATNTPAKPTAPAKPAAVKSTIIAIKVHFELNTPDKKRRVIFGLEKDTQGDKVIWKINFQLLEREDTSKPFSDPIVSIDIEVDKLLHPNAEKAAKDGLTPDQSAHAIGPAADDQKAAKEGQLDQKDADQTTQDTLAT
ncbi:MAG: hypothetical protein QOJ02_2637 [Acidobacteriota bacterium]|jgi:hypothetical protein|nr:hypothetical protein [Acidobacteriota bacterium]